jgi:hypothetical protein
MKCPKCNRNNPPGAKYCYNCGAALRKSSRFSDNFVGNLTAILIPGYVFDGLMALILLVISITDPFVTPPPGGWGLFPGKVWRLLYVSSVVSLALAGIIAFSSFDDAKSLSAGERWKKGIIAFRSFDDSSGKAPLILLVPLGVVGYIAGATLILEGCGIARDDATQWKLVRLFLLSSHLLYIFSFAALFKKAKS